MTEDEGIIIDAKKWFPEAARRVEILERLRRSWEMVVRMPAIARNSWPIILGVNELTVEVRDDAARERLSKMKGNIEGALRRLGYKADGDFAVKIVGLKRRENKTVGKKARRKVVIDEEKVRQYMSNTSGTLPEDISQSLSNLMAYLDGRAKAKKSPGLS